jgi:hypothetical protein
MDPLSSGRNNNRGNMKTLVATILLCILLALAGCERSPWQEFNSKEGAFAVIMPGAPAEKSQIFSTRIGPVEAHFFTVEHGNAVYMIVYGDYPEVPSAAEDRDRLLDAARDGAVGNIRGTLLEERAVSLSGHPGREARIHSSDGGLELLMRIYLVDSRQYQVVTVFPKDSVPSKDRDRFFESFKLTGG